jgi:tetratricopeptide (TPR) repeat protein
VEYVWLQRAAQAPVFSPAQAACLEQAFAAEPKNPETAYALGEAWRIQSAEGGDNYRELAGRAMEWFKRCMELNPWGGYSHMRYGWCLDWVGRGAESPPYFERAIELDPKGYFMAVNVGLHHVQAGNFAAARTWFERSLRLDGRHNMIAKNYLPIVNSRLQEAATNEISAQLSAPLK